MTNGYKMLTTSGVLNVLFDKLIESVYSKW